MRLSFALLYGWIACTAAPGAANRLAATNTTTLQSPSKQTKTRGANPWFSKTREQSLAWLPGKFIVVGCEPDSGKTYRGSVSVIRQGDRLLIKKTIGGQVISGTGTITLEPETPVLEVAYRAGHHTVRAGYEFRRDDMSQPRVSGWVSPVDGGFEQRDRLGLEVWYYDRPAPPPPSSFRLKNPEARHNVADELLGLFEGKYRVIGEETNSGRIYTGKMTAQVDGTRLKVIRTIDGRATEGQLILRLSADRHFSPIARCRIGTRAVVSVLDGQTVGDNYPRLCGYFYPVDASGSPIPTEKPMRETWFFDWGKK